MLLVYLLAAGLVNYSAAGRMSDAHWSFVHRPLVYVSIGPAGVWSVDAYSDIFYRRGSYGSPYDSGYSWQKIPGTLKQLDVGRDVVWGVNLKDQIFYRAGITATKPEGEHWVKVEGYLKQVSVDENNRLWGVNKDNKIYRRVGVSSTNPRGTKWESVPGSLKQISVGLSGVWGVDESNTLYSRDPSASSWRQFNELYWKSIRVSSGDDQVFTIDSNSKIHYLNKVRTKGNRDDWRELSNKSSFNTPFFKQVEVYKNALWAVNIDHAVWVYDARIIYVN